MKFRYAILILLLTLITIGATFVRENNLVKTPAFAVILRDGYGMQGTNATMLGQKTIEGSSIAIFDPAKKGEIAIIFETKTGFILDMTPSFDGKKIMFSYKEDIQSPFHIWEIKTDGTGLRQITKGNYHDVSPVYLPDGKILFTSTRGESYSMCQNYLAFTLHVADYDGNNIERIDFTTICTVSPSLMNDGRILMARWEYQDKNLSTWQGLWTIHPDGRNMKLYHGNTFVIPNSVYGGKEIPGTNKVITTIAAHHYPPIGDIAIVDRSKGLETDESMWKITHATSFEITRGADWKSPGLNREYQIGDVFHPWGFCDPYPISSEYSLVSSGDENKKKHMISLLHHSDGEEIKIYEHPGKSCFSPISLEPRKVPHQLPYLQFDNNKKTGTFQLYNIYEGLKQKGVKAGEVKALRIIEVMPKTTHVQGPRQHDEYPIMSMGTFYAKSNHGTVPVKEDGSACFEAPANKEIYFIALDKDGKEIQRMGSITQIRPGDFVSCIGCHEDRLNTPANYGKPAAYTKPDMITAPSWGAGPMDYVKHVQPVLDKYCIKCHSGLEPKAGMDLTGDKTRFFNMSYLSLCNPEYIEYYFLNTGPTGIFPAKETGSYVSKLTKMIENNHGDINMDDDDRRAIYAWIDANVPYYATFDVTRPEYVGGRDILEGGNIPGAKTILEVIKKYLSEDEGVGWYWSLYGKEYQTFSEEKINFTHPDKSRFLYENLAKSAGGLAEDHACIYSSKEDPEYIKLLDAITQVSEHLKQKPRMDMPGAVSAPKLNLWGHTFEN